MKVIYVVNSFPTTSETFVYTEVRELLTHGLELFFYPLRKDKTGQNALDLENRCISRTLKLPSWFYLIRLIFRDSKRILRFIADIIKETKLKPRKLLSKLSSLSHAAKLHKFIYEDDEKDNFHLHCHFAGRTAEVCLYLKVLFNIDYSITVHATDIYVLDNRLDLINRLNNAKRVRAISSYGKKYLLQNNLITDPDQIEVIHCGIKINRETLGMQKDDLIGKKVILSVGRLVEKKGYKYLLNALPRIILSYPNILLVIVGDGPLMSELKTYTEKMNIKSNVLFTRSINNFQVHEWLSIAKVFVLACIKDSKGDMDGIPVALIESMAIGLPVVSTYLSGIPELLINEVNGMLVEPNNSFELSESILRLLSDENYAKKLATKGKKFVEKNFNIEFQAKKLMNFFCRSEK